MKLSKKHKIALVELLILVGVVAWLFFPRSFESVMGYGFDKDQVTQVTATMVAGPETREITLTPGEADYEEFMALMESQKYLIAGIGETDTDRENKLGCETTLIFETPENGYGIFFCGDQMMDFTCTEADKARTLQTLEGLPFQERLLAFLLNVEPLEAPAE